MIKPVLPLTFSTPQAIAILLFAATMGAGSNVAARFSFDEGTGALLALVSRSLGVSLALALFLPWRSLMTSMNRRQLPWVVLLGLVITLQGVSMYSALARIPVAIALLGINSFPWILVLMNWVFNGRRPSRLRLILILLMLGGLALALQVPGRILSAEPTSADWLAGVFAAFVAATCFAGTLWITEHRVAQVPGTVRNGVGMLIVVVSSMVLSQTGLLPDAFDVPGTLSGKLALAGLAALFTAAFCTLFLLAPRLDMARNAPVMNMEPILAMVLAWWVLGQALEPDQILGALIVVAGVMAMSRLRN